MPHARSASGVCHPADALPRRGTRPASQKARTQLQNHGLQFLCQSGSLFRTSATQSVAEDQTLVCGHNRRRAYSQYIGFITPCIGIGSLFQQASNALCNEIGIASEPFLRIICSQHHHQCIQGRMAHHTGRKVGKAAQPFGDGVVKHRRYGPAGPPQSRSSPAPAKPVYGTDISLFPHSGRPAPGRIHTCLNLQIQVYGAR